MGRCSWCMSSCSLGEFVRPLDTLRNEGQDLSKCWGHAVPSTAPSAQSVGSVKVRGIAGGDQVFITSQRKLGLGVCTME